MTEMTFWLDYSTLVLRVVPTNPSYHKCEERELLSALFNSRQKESRGMVISRGRIRAALL